MQNLLVITPISHIRGLKDKLNSCFDLMEYPDPLFNDILKEISWANAIYTNPNKSKIPIDKYFLDLGTNLKAIATASTGLIHIDIEEVNRRQIKVISLTKEIQTIEKISSTAEHALALTLAVLRRVPWAFEDVLRGNWDYEKFIGRQLDHLTIGVVGWGRLGKMYARYVQALGAKVLVCDPAYKQSDCPHPMNNLEEIVRYSDIISIHIHATKDNIGLFGKRLLAMAKPDLIVINTSRGEIIDEVAMVEFLERNPKAMLASDVLTDELQNKWKSPILDLAKRGGNVLITPHIGGMTQEAQEIAYHRVADMLIEFLC